jgi:hypothetical protein
MGIEEELGDLLSENYIIGFTWLLVMQVNQQTVLTNY